MLKCRNCKLIFEESGGYFKSLDGHCPTCGNKLVEMCENDTGSCEHGVVDGAVRCDKCGQYMCPICSAHDVEVLSRTTGYYGPLSAFGAGKQQEFIDRKRYEV